jgi:DNA ligase-1
MLLLSDLGEISEKVGSTTKKKEKTSLLAHFLQQTRGEEILLVASYLSGQLPQGRLGIGWSMLQATLRKTSVRISHHPDHHSRR